MRVTNTGMIATQNYKLQNNLRRMDTLNEQLNTGKVVNRSSDDPYEARRIMNLKNEIAYTEKYNKNIDEVTGWLESTDGTLNEATNILDSLMVDIIAVGNGAYGDQELKVLQTQINEKIGALGDVLNNAHGDKYLMGGTELEKPPILIDQGPPVQLSLNLYDADDNPNGIKESDLNGKLNINIGENITTDYNLSVTEFFGYEDEDNQGFLGTINRLSEVMDKIANPDRYEDEEIDVDELKKELIFGEGNTLQTQVKDMFNHVVNKRTEIGTTIQKTEQVKQLNETSIEEMTKVLSVKQDTDYAQKIVEYSTASLIYQASLKVSADIVQKSIMDYIR
ncbi:MAG: hypothetical protein R3Y64_11465 [Peptostreptococcaceae bacterium]